LPVYEDPGFRKKMKRMIEEFKEQENRIAELESTKDKMEAVYRITGTDEESLESCQNELEDLVRVLV